MKEILRFRPILKQNPLTTAYIRTTALIIHNIKTSP